MLMAVEGKYGWKTWEGCRKAERSDIQSGMPMHPEVSLEFV